MPVIAVCPCTARYTLKDELEGAVVKCPKCSVSFTVPTSRPSGPPPAGVDPLFHRNYFLLRQRHFAIDEKYHVWDEKGEQILFIERPTHLARHLAAILGGLAAGAFTAYFVYTVSSALWPTIGLTALIPASILAVLALIVASVMLAPLRHATIYRDESKAEPLLEVRQDQRFVFLNVTFTVRLPDGTTLAKLGKNHLYDIIRKRWQVYRPDGRLWATAMEDSVLLALLRRLLGTLYGALRINFIILRGDSEEVLGEFNRNLTILDRYVLSMTADTQMHLDRRVALGLGVLLDSAERR